MRRYGSSRTSIGEREAFSPITRQVSFKTYPIVPLADKRTVLDPAKPAA